jgi:hypothetical protein
VPIPRHTDYHHFDLQRRTVILKVHGAVHRADEREDSFVITEDHYIDYLARANIAKLIPAQLMATMMRSHFLFLGYGMRDWNLRVILHHIWSQQVRKYASWAIERRPTRMDELFWQQHGVEIVSTTLREWVESMRAGLP